jgi:dTDP-4-amino-4,6-dideoxygalactose transaminase
VPVDADPVTMNCDANAMASAITKKTKAIIPVHLYGLPVDVATIRKSADTAGIPVLEDAAQAHGATWGGKAAGSLGTAAGFSFYPGKNLGAFGDGGAITSNDEALVARVKALANYGSEKKYYHDFQGVNARLDELQAAFLRVKLRALPAWNARRQAIATRYLAGLADAKDLVLPGVPKPATHVWHLFVVRHPRRDALQKALAELGVATQIHYPVPSHRAGAYAGTDVAKAHLPVTDAICSQVLSLPIGPHMSDADVDLVIERVHQALRTLP